MKDIGAFGETEMENAHILFVDDDLDILLASLWALNQRRIDVLPFIRAHYSLDEGMDTFEHAGQKGPAEGVGANIAELNANNHL